MTRQLWAPGPAFEWTDAYPLGDGRLGAMVFGGPTREEIQFNEATLWSGGPHDPSNPEALTHLPEVRRLIFAGDFAAAEALANRHLMGRPYLMPSYQPAGRLFLDFPHRVLFSDYRRSLDLATALHEVSYTVAGVRHRRECFIGGGVFALRLTADRPGSISLAAQWITEQPGQEAVSDGRIDWQGTNRPEQGIPAALRLAMGLRLRAEGGEVHGASVTGADAVTLLVDIATSFRRFDDVGADPGADVATRLDGAGDFAALRARHLGAHRALWQGFSLDLGRTEAAQLPTAQRIERFSQAPDPDLAALYVDYGRYLLISSSRPGGQPATLQGLWNKELRPPWGSKMTTNINLQMNYWLADPAGLAPCFEPLLRLLEELSVTGARTARVHYGARGWVLHHNTDLWRSTAPIDGAQWGLWPSGGFWLCAQAWDHAGFAGYPPALVDRLRPVLEGAARFALDILVEDPSGLLVTCPSLSPENVHPHGATICAGPAMDAQLLRDLFAATLASGCAADLGAEIGAALPRLPPDRIGAGGQLQEWAEDWDAAAPEPLHRHVSHLYGLYPGLQFLPHRAPDLAAAARRSLETRGDDATGWGVGWRINLWARLGEGARAHDVLTRLLHPARSYGNLFDAHPPFQIDGNFGGAAGVLEMLAQSDGETVFLLPALPPHWPEGRVSGLRLRGGLTVDFAWDAGAVTALTLTAQRPFAGRVQQGDRLFARGLAQGRTQVI